ncbi:sulfatase-like hydrolase/transferase [Haladaptatus sp. GCM10025707]|uniref:sulfatase-like hydrolase/transferase n=1 Tax=unclassified Haladaptatus TaxID=2622732 RepID=UPI0023E8812D|nr:sulfatase-like hydrolase/transferase [Haladaptatus sp. QDMS2]
MTRNVVLLCLDTVRKDFFDRFATRLRDRADVTFEQCRAASCWSVPSHASMVTGELPSEHGIHAKNPRLDALTDRETIRDDLPDHRFLGVSSNIYAGSNYGFDVIFDEFVDIARDHRYPDALDASTFISEETDSGLSRYSAILRACLSHPETGKSFVNTIAAQLQHLSRNGPLASFPAFFDDGAVSARRAALDLVARTDDPYFLFVNFMEGHEPHRDTWQYDRDSYDVPTGWSSRPLQTWDAVDPSTEIDQQLGWYRDLYGASISYLDEAVDEFVTDLLAATDRETTVVITADHGENLARPEDDGHLGHTTSLTEGVLHVPLLVINPPDGYDPAETDYVSHRELRRLLAGLANGETPDVTADRIPAEVLAMTPGNDPLRETDPEYWTRRIRCVYDGETKYEWDSLGTQRAVKLDHTNPCWQAARTDTTVPSWATAEFGTSLDAVSVVEREPTNQMDDAVLDRLEDLGYR